MTASTLSVLSEESETGSELGGAPDQPAYWWASLLGPGDLSEADPGRGAFLVRLQALAGQKAALLADDTLGEEERRAEMDRLTVDGARLEDLDLTFQYSPSSKVFGYEVETCCATLNIRDIT